MCINNNLWTKCDYFLHPFYRSYSPTTKRLLMDDKRRARRPFHFRNNIAVGSESPHLSSTEVVPSDNAQEATYSRYKYYQRLRGPPQGDTALV